MVINSTPAASTYLSSAADVQPGSQNAVTRAAGSAAATATNPAGTVGSSNLDSSLNSLVAAQSNVTNAISFTQTQSAYLSRIGAALDTMQQLAQSAQTSDASDADRSAANQQYQQLSSYISQAAGQDFNGVSLFNGATLPINTDSASAPFSLSGVDLGDADYKAVLNANLSSPEAAGSATGSLQNAAQKLALDHHTVLENQSQLTTASDQLSMASENFFSSAQALITPSSVSESVASARSAILGNSPTALSAQANQLPQSVLNLLPQSL